MPYETLVYNHKTTYCNNPEDHDVKDFIQHEGYSFHQSDISLLYIPPAIRFTSLLYEIWGFHSSDDIDDFLLGLGTMWTDW
jgi:hypothetical protein